MTTTSDTATQQDIPWQIKMFRRSLKKQLKLDALLEFAGDLSGKDCLLVTCGDNNGALNWYFRAQGGVWTWADVDGDNLEQISQLLGEPVLLLPEDQFPFEKECYDCVISIDVLEHLEDDQPFLLEINRVLKPGGTAIVTVPNGDAMLLANRIKWRVGMIPEVYGHTRAGYTMEELARSISQAGLIPIGEGGYSRFFTEMVELAINYSYVYLLSRKQNNSSQGHIAPTSSGELQTHGTAYRLYSLVYPLMRLISKLDLFLPEDRNYAVTVLAVKPANKDARQ
jgi:2-polyprenyl-3-methyl-5-hydroxy-6-metoxy-1,4-benzoquinol methylase